MTVRLRGITYHAVVFSPDANGGPGTAKAELDPGLINLAWQGYMNLPSRAAFTLLRKNTVLDSIAWMQDHIKIYRESSKGVTPVFAGKLVKPAYGTHDAVVQCWDYTAFLSRSRSGPNVTYPSKLVGSEIVSPEWAAAKAATNSLFTFVTTGTIEDPLGLDGVTAIKTNADFGVNLFSRLFTFYNLAEMAMANTSNNVVFGISRTSPHTFTFLKNKGTAKLNDYALTYPGTILDYQFDPGWDQYVNDLATLVNDSTTGAASEYDATTADVATSAYRRLQDTAILRTLMGVTGATTETDQMKAATQRQLSVRSRAVPNLMVTPTPGYYHPYDGHDLGDTLRVRIANSAGTGAVIDAMLRLYGLNVAWNPDAGELSQLYLRSVP